MSLFIKEEYFNKNDYTFLYQYNSADEFLLRICEIMVNRGYRNIGGDVYEKGNGTLRTLLGAFYKHYKMEMWHNKENFTNAADRQAKLRRFLNFYNPVKPHKGLNGAKHYEILKFYFNQKV